MAGFTSYGASVDGNSVRKLSFNKKRLLILGSEDRGISKRAREKVDKFISIPMKRDFELLGMLV